VDERPRQLTMTGASGSVYDRRRRLRRGCRGGVRRNRRFVTGPGSAAMQPGFQQVRLRRRFRRRQRRSSRYVLGQPRFDLGALFTRQLA
jgi:hypothetical protein